MAFGTFYTAGETPRAAREVLLGLGCCLNGFQGYGDALADADAHGG